MKTKLNQFLVYDNSHQPETDFELQVISNFGHDDKKIKAFLKCGLTPADIIGLKIIKEK